MFSVLLFLFIFIYTLLGMALFAYEIKLNVITHAVDLSSEGAYPNSNFNNFIEAFVAVFVIISGDEWSTIFFDAYRAVGPITSSLYFLSCLIIG